MSVDTRDAARPLEPLEPPLVNPGRVGGLRDVFRRRYLLKLLLRKELKVRYQGSLVGLAWSYVKPAVRFAMYYWVLGLILTHALENRPLHIFAGMIMATFMTNALSAGCRSVVKNAALVRKINLPREMFPVASILVSAYHMVPMYVMLTFVCILVGWQPDMYAAAAALLAVAIVLVWGLAAALVLSAWNVVFRDTQNIVDVLQTLIHWTVPMIYPFIIIAEKLQEAHHTIYEIYLASPLCIAVLLNDRAFWIPASETPRQAAIEQLPTHLFDRGLIMLAIGFVFLWFAQRVFARLEGRFAEKL